MSEYKTFEKLKEELGDKFEEYMYKVNIELLSKIDKAIGYIKENEFKASDGEVCYFCNMQVIKNLLYIY